MEVDASDYATERVLLIECKDGKQKYITFSSRIIQSAERNYKIYNKELLAIVEVLIKQRQYIKIVNGRLYFIFSFHFILLYFTFSFLIFHFQNNLGQGLSVTQSHQSQIDGIVTRLIMGLGRRKQKILEQSDIIQHGQHMLASCHTHGHLGQGAQQLARTMGNSI